MKLPYRLLLVLGTTAGAANRTHICALFVRRTTELRQKLRLLLAIQGIATQPLAIQPPAHKLRVDKVLRRSAEEFRSDYGTEGYWFKSSRVYCL